MTWIDDRLAERQKRDEHEQLIADHAETIFNDLWAEIKRSVDEAKSKQIPVYTNGATYERVVLLSVIGPTRHAQVFGEQVSQQQSPPKRLHIKLAKDNSGIIISGPPEKLYFDVSEDNVVCLKCDKNQISIHDAARAILDPFLFPELNQPKSN